MLGELNITITSCKEFTNIKVVKQGKDHIQEYDIMVNDEDSQPPKEELKQIALATNIFNICKMCEGIAMLFPEKVETKPL